MQAIDPSTLPVTEFSTSLGLAFVPPTPAMRTLSHAGPDGQEDDNGRQEIREKKNVNRYYQIFVCLTKAYFHINMLIDLLLFRDHDHDNFVICVKLVEINMILIHTLSFCRALDKLKKQIKEAKEAKRQRRLAAKNQSEESIDSSNQISNGKHGPSNNNTTDGNEDDDLLVVKQVHNWDVNNEENDDDSLSINNSKLKKKKKKPLKIRSDGTLKSAISPTITYFDDTGENVINKKRVLTSDIFNKNISKDSNAIAGEVDIEEHTRRVKARIDSGRYEDRMREKDRVRGMHKERRLRDRGDRTDAEYSAVLDTSGLEPFDSNSDMDDDADDDNNRNSVSEEGDDDEDDDEGEDSDEEQIDNNISDIEQRALRLLS